MSTIVSASPSAPASVPLQTYLDLDLAHGSPIAQDLFARAEREARRPSLSLTGDGDKGAISANLTQEMLAWANAHVGHKRQAALNEIAAAARRIRTGNSEGVCAEIEEDYLKRERNARKTDETRGFYIRHQSRIDALNALQQEHDGLQFDEGGRDALVPSRLAAIGLPALVAVPEAFMNYTSFVAMTGLGVAGAGLTAVVGGAIGVSAYFAGQFWKGWKFYMRADDEDQQQTGFRMLWLASALLFVSLTVAGYARYKMVAARALQQIILGLDPTNPVISTALLLAGNLLVFFLGASLTYLIHDENPLFAQKAHKLRQERRGFEAIRRRQLDEKIGEIDRRYRQDLDRMRKRADLMRNQVDYAVVAEDIGRLSAKDHEVVGLLQAYRGLLVEGLENRDPDFLVTASSSERQGGVGSGSIGLSEFAVQPLHLYRAVR